MKLQRWWVQTISLIGLHSSWGPELKWFCNPAMTCHSCALSWFACPIGVFVHYSGYHLFPYIALGTLLLIGALIGRMLCGWVCPFGFLMDLLHKIPSPKFTLPRWTKSIKYIVLISTVFLIPYLWGETTEYSFCQLCPTSALQVTIPYLITTGGTAVIDLMTAIKLAILAVVIILGIVAKRSFCTVLCPIGAIMAPLNYLSFWAMKPPTNRCISCAKCDRECPTTCKPSTRLLHGVPANRTAECIVCHECQKGCCVGDVTTSPEGLKG